MKREKDKEPIEMVPSANLIKNAQVEVSESNTSSSPPRSNYVHPFEGAIVV